MIATVVCVNVVDKKYYFKPSKYFYRAWAYMLFACIFLWACDNFYIGKSSEEIEKDLYESMWEVDSILKRIQYQLDTININNENIIILKEIEWNNKNEENIKNN